MRLRTKLLFLFLASGLFLLAQGLAAAYVLRVVGRDVDSLQRFTQTDDLAAQIKIELDRLPRVADLEQQGQTGRERRRLLDQADRTLIVSRSLQRLTNDEASLAAVERVQAAVLDYRAAGSALALALQEERGATLQERSQALDAERQVFALLSEGEVEPVGHEARLATKAVVRRAEVLNRWVTLGGLSLAVFLTLASAVVLARVTAQPVVRLLRAARDVGAGNLDVSLPVRGNDELSEISQAFNDMTGRLRKVYEGLEAEVKKRTDELAKREQDLERERRLAAIGRLAAGVAHEVSNPLAVIATAAEGLRDRASTSPELGELEAFEDFPDYLEMIESEAYRLKRLVRRLLNFARTQPGDLHALDMAYVLHDAVQLVRLDPLAKEFPIHTAIEAPLPVMGNPDSLKQAVLNLLFNALKAVKDAGPDGGEVWLSARIEDDEVVEIEISDDGKGIEPGDLDRVFEPFFTTAKEGEGTGLGLALVYGTIERHGGTITAESDGPGQGAIFRIELPLCDEEIEPFSAESAELLTAPEIDGL